MTTTAYASADPDPIANPDVDAILAQGDLPLSVALFGDALDSGDPTPVWSWSWVILYKPPGSSAALDNATIQNPTLENIDIWGTYRLLLIATNTNTPEASDSNPLSAPTASIVQVRVQSDARALEKPGDHQRNWTPILHTLIQAVEDIPDGLGPHAIADHTDVAQATGADLDVLVSQGLADDPDAPGTSLHTHRGVDIPAASAAARGAILTEAAPLDPGNPKAINAERIYLTATIPTADPGNPQPQILFRTPDADMEVDSWAVAWIDGGDGAGGVPPGWIVNLLEGSKADVESSSMALIDPTATLGGQGASNNAPLVLESATGQGWPLTAGRYLGVEFTSVDIPPYNPGGSVTATVVLIRRA